VELTNAQPVRQCPVGYFLIYAAGFVAKNKNSSFLYRFEKFYVVRLSAIHL
jgi:hypothetical protein